MISILRQELNKDTDLKSLIFGILTKESPLKLIELTNIIRKRYGKAITFQAVRKAVLYLVKENILEKKGKGFQINKGWISSSKELIDRLYVEIHQETKAKERYTDDTISVFTFNSLNEMMKFWQELIDQWFKKFQSGDPSTNAYQGAHSWEGLLHLDKEQQLMGQLKKKGIKSYTLTTGNTPLDKNIKKFYTSIGLKFRIDPSQKSYDRAYYVGTYGDMVIESRYPDEIVRALDKFFKKNKTIEGLNLKELSDIANKKIPMKLTVMKNKEIAKRINESILTQFKD